MVSGQDEGSRGGGSDLIRSDSECALGGSWGTCWVGVRESVGWFCFFIETAELVMLPLTERMEDEALGRKTGVEMLDL